LIHFYKRLVKIKIFMSLWLGEIDTKDTIIRHKGNNLKH